VTTTPASPLDVLARAIDQAAAILGEVRADDLDRPTPCDDWSVGQLADHLVAAPGRFVQMMHGEQPDWSAQPDQAEGDRVAAFREGAAALLRTWREQGDSAAASADWQSAELGQHAWDLARGIGRPTEDLDAEVAQRGLDFMRANLTPDRRGSVFAAERPVPEGASVPDRLAAFSGRDV
jgi:uncharacterized protein (TIGR03086 family)